MPRRKKTYQDALIDKLLQDQGPEELLKSLTATVMNRADVLQHLVCEHRLGQGLFKLHVFMFQLPQTLGRISGMNEVFRPGPFYGPNLDCFQRNLWSAKEKGKVQ